MRVSRRSYEVPAAKAFSLSPTNASKEANLSEKLSLGWCVRSGRSPGMLVSTACGPIRPPREERCPLRVCECPSRDGAGSAAEIVGVDVPHGCCTCCPVAENVAAVGIEGRGRPRDGSAAGKVGAVLLARADVPQAHRAVGASRREELPGRIELRAEQVAGVRVERRRGGPAVGCVEEGDVAALRPAGG